MNRTRLLIKLLAMTASLFIWDLGLAGAADDIKVEGPLGSSPVVYGTTTFDLSTVGYEQAEFDW
jgi:hypothetical protein